MASEAELAWAAGLFEGEGSIGIDRRTSRHGSLRLQIGMCDEEVLCRFKDVVGIGNVTGPYQHKGGVEKGWSPFWAWSITGRRAEACIELLRP